MEKSNKYEGSDGFENDLDKVNDFKFTKILLRKERHCFQR